MRINNNTTKIKSIASVDLKNTIVEGFLEGKANNAVVSHKKREVLNKMKETPKVHMRPYYNNLRDLVLHKNCEEDFQLGYVLKN